MTDLEQLVAAVMTQWRADGGDDSGAIAVNALLDRVLPYRVARRILGIEASEDYEVLVLRLLAEEEALVRVTPPGAAEMARTTSSSKLPDLAVLQLLRSATFTMTERALAQAADSSPVPKLKDTSVWAAELAP